ncbi:hypothetical protein ES705_15372 [subsurface metagenome]
MCFSVDFMVGTRYGGNSITKGISSVRKKVFFNILAIVAAIKMPIRYIINKISPGCLGKNAPMIKIYTGSLALHDIKGLISMVTRRLFLFSMVLVAIMAGTLQPKPIIRGINDRPCNPILCMILSIIKAARAM